MDLNAKLKSLLGERDDLRSKLIVVESHIQQVKDDLKRSKVKEEVKDRKGSPSQSTPSREALAYKLRNDGLTWKAVGQQLSVGPQRAIQLFKQYERRLRSGSIESGGFPPAMTRGLVNILKAEYGTFENSVAAYREKGTSAILDLPNVGKALMYEFLEFADSK